MRVSRGEFRCASKVVAQCRRGFLPVNANFASHAINVNKRKALVKREVGFSLKRIFLDSKYDPDRALA
jgi:hypothetical protein